ncbi:propanediol dehydratase small subunit [Klebsiella pneumoniae]|uniref:Propanediol dehydratase small subunit n=1 Tax=Klebsiella pneumoniae TaxID=573 RepID=A0A377WST5_KLEPN|nr:propanediol dehydratase small subunit [Klebsiella pneumoniae]
MNTDAIESMVRDVLSRMNSLQDGITPAPAAPTNDTVRQPKVKRLPVSDPPSGVGQNRYQ